MNIYHVNRTQGGGYDTYSDFVVCAPDEETARNTNPGTGAPMTNEDWASPFSDWCSSPEHVAVSLVGIAAPSASPGVICASYHAG